MSEETRGGHVRIAVIEPGKEPYTALVKTDEEGWCDEALSELVGGDTEYYYLLFGEEPALVYNDSMIDENLPPNRVVFAKEWMVDAGYMSLRDCNRTVFGDPKWVPGCLLPSPKRVLFEGEVHIVLQGTFLAVSHGEDGRPRDITDEELERVAVEFGGPDLNSGREAVAAIREDRIEEFEEEHRSRRLCAGLDDLERDCGLASGPTPSLSRLLREAAER